MKILIAKETNQLRSGKVNAKLYPFWAEFYALAKEHQFIEINSKLNTKQLIELVNSVDCVISIDSFLPHFIKYHNLKPRVIVLWGQSDPLIFGYPDNINLLKDRKYLRPDQFGWWEDLNANNEAFVSPETLLGALNGII